MVRNCPKNGAEEKFKVRQGETKNFKTFSSTVGVNLMWNLAIKKTSEQLAIRGQTELLVFPEERREREEERNRIGTGATPSVVGMIAQTTRRREKNVAYVWRNVTVASKHIYSTKRRKK